MDYEKFYDLESYIFKEVATNFHDRGYLIPEEFFCIIIWKANRAKSKIAKKFSRDIPLETSIREMTSSIYRQSTPKAKLAVLMNDYGFRLPISSAILSVLYKGDFSVYDIRVCNILEEKYKTRKYHNIQNLIFDNLWLGYEDYLHKILEASGKTNYREADRYLWSKSFYSQLSIDLDNRFDKK